MIGSFGWGSQAVKQVSGLLSSMKAEMLEPVIAKGYPNDADMKKLDELADSILEKHKSLDIA